MEMRAMIPGKTSLPCRLSTRVAPARSATADLLGYLDRVLREVEALYRNQPGILAVVRLIGAIPDIMGHGVLSECLVAPGGDAARLMRMLRLSIYAIATAILLPVKTGER
jgi:hypothetical protein